MSIAIKESKVYTFSMELTVGEKILILRKRAKLSQEALAKKLDINKSNIPKYENDSYLPSLKVASKLSKIFKVPIEFFS